MPAAAEHQDTPASATPDTAPPVASQDTPPAAAQGDALARAGVSASASAPPAPTPETTASPAASLSAALYAVGLRPSRVQVVALLERLGGSPPASAYLTRDTWRARLLAVADDQATPAAARVQALQVYGRDRGWCAAAGVRRAGKGGVMLEAGEGVAALEPIGGGQLR